MSNNDILKKRKTVWQMTHACRSGNMIHIDNFFKTQIMDIEPNILLVYIEAAINTGQSEAIKYLLKHFFDYIFNKYPETKSMCNYRTQRILNNILNSPYPELFPILDPYLNGHQWTDDINDSSPFTPKWNLAEEEKWSILEEIYYRGGSERVFILYLTKCPDMHLIRRCVKWSILKSYQESMKILERYLYFGHGSDPFQEKKDRPIMKIFIEELDLDEDDFYSMGNLDHSLSYQIFYEVILECQKDRLRRPKVTQICLYRHNISLPKTFFSSFQKK